jgi:hypothetical protein
MKTKSEILHALDFFSGTEQWHRWSSLFPKVVLTDGAKFLAEACDAYWLMDAIASYQPDCQTDEMLREFQVWTLKVDTAHSAVLTCERDTNDLAFTKYIKYTDFPLDTIKLYCNPGGPQGTQVILLPSEY